MKAFAIHSKRTYLDNTLKDATLIIEKGLIQRIENGLPSALDIPLIDVGDKVLMPGIIDPHVHINEPGRTDWEGFDTATKAAAAGGITTVVDMPLNSSPVSTNLKNFLKKISAAQGKMHVHCGFWGGLVPDNLEDIDDLVKAGVLGLKAFLSHSGIDEFPNVSSSDLKLGMEALSKYKLPLLAHCELELDHAEKQAHHKAPQSYQAWLKSRPANWELAAIDLLIKTSKETNCPAHIVHLATQLGLKKIAKAKQEGLQLTVETCPHYLYFNSENIPDAKTAYKCAPPIRNQKNNQALFTALLNGEIDSLGSDHSPAPPEIKELETGDFSKAWGGIAGLQFSLPLLCTLAKKNKQNWLDCIPAFTSRPAKLIGQEKLKGTLAPGYHADLVVWEPETSFVVEEKNIFHKHKVTPYLGEKLYGKVSQTYVGGVQVYHNNEFVNLNQGSIVWNKYKKVGG